MEELEPRLLLSGIPLAPPDIPAGINTVLFAGANVLADGPAKGLDENFISDAPNAEDVLAGGDDNIAPNGATASGNNYGFALNQAVGMTESIRVDGSAVAGGRSGASNLLTGALDAIFNDAIQGINLPQPQYLPSFDFRSTALNSDGVVGQHGARTGAVTFYTNNNPAGPDFSLLEPAGSSTGQAFNLTPLRVLAAPGFSGLIDDGLAPGSLAGDGIPDFAPFQGVPFNGNPVAPRSVAFILEFVDRAAITGFGGNPDGAEASLLPRYQLFDDTTTTVIPESPPFQEQAFNHNEGNRAGGATGDDIDDAVDGTLLLGGEIANARATLTWTEIDGSSTTPGFQPSGKFTLDLQFTADIHWDEGALYDNNLVGDPVGGINAQWSNIPFNLNSDGSFDALSTLDDVGVDGVMVDVTNAAPGQVGDGGWDFLLENSPTVSDYDFDAFGGGQGFPTGTGSNDVSFYIQTPVNGSIHGIKFEDLNKNGVDDGEPRLEGVTITLTGDFDGDGVVDMVDVQTDANGEYWFLNLSPGDYTVSETVPTGYFNTTPTSVDVTVGNNEELVAVPGQANLPPDDPRVEVHTPELAFGNIQEGSIHGIKFEDLNKNGVDDSEPRLEGVTITLTGDVDGDGVNDSVDVQTDSNGEYWFLHLYPGDYTVSETVPTGYFATTATSTMFTVGSGEEWVAVAGQATLQPGQEEVVTSSLAFGNIQEGSIHGIKFEDLNVNGVNDSEPRLEGVTITLTGDIDGDGVGDSVDVQTDANGEYWFLHLYPGDYTVSETVPTGFINTTSTSVDVTVGSGEELVAVAGQATLQPGQEEVLTGELAFGNAMLGSIHGIKFLDEHEADHGGRMTGGGSVFTEDGMRVTHGFELHCNPLIGPNNLEINFNGNQFHLEQLTSATCTDTELDQLPRQAPFDTYVGEGVGRFNGEFGYTIEFTLTDAGEPGTGDRAAFLIKDPDGVVILDVDGNLHNGNHQAHPENKKTDNVPVISDGVYNGDEPLLDGVTINLLVDGTVVQTTVTSNGGQYWFTGLTPGVTYTVEEVPPIGSTQTTSNPPPILILSGQEYVATVEQGEYLVNNEGIAPDKIVVEPLLAFGNAFVEEGGGRMTGGGSVFTEDGMRVTHGFELHCNPLIGPNNLEINFEGNQFHLEQLTSATCTDTELNQLPRQAPFDTYEGVGLGRFNGVSGYSIVFTLTDAGEPGRNDRAAFLIKDPDGNVVLDVDNLLTFGNHQAHPENKSAPSAPAGSTTNTLAADVINLNDLINALLAIPVNGNGSKTGSKDLTTNDTTTELAQVDLLLDGLSSDNSVVQSNGYGYGKRSR